MNKILVNIFIPELQQDVDMFIPTHLQTFAVLPLVLQILQQITDGLFVPNEQTALCYLEDGTILDLNTTIQELGLKNGAKLMVV